MIVHIVVYIMLMSISNCCAAINIHLFILFYLPGVARTPSVSLLIFILSPLCGAGPSLWRTCARALPRWTRWNS
jgi:hypothetical protein